ncbi:M4 family metallopeptidase [Pseudomonas alcaligenes]|uniref:M4 family metallopeptidase n=1 Tax=Pseudomonas sp. RIT-PI-AD TaxID=3035294 RepID=UPI0021DA7816
MSENRVTGGVLPPYLLDHLARHGDDHLRACASGTLSLDHRRDLLGRDGAERPRIAAALAGTAQRHIYDAGGRTELPGALVRTEGQPQSGDVAVDDAYDYLGATYAFFWEVFGRHSIDNAGLPLLGSVHYGEHYENAFWDGAQMVFGDGDGKIFNRFTIALDVIGHELSHGVIEHEAGLVYQNQAGALNESLSDVFGTLVKQYHLRQKVEQADWIIGAGLFTDAVKAVGLRSMKAPGSAYDDPLLGKDPQPGHMRDLVVTRQDNGGVHINSGIPNRAFYLLASALGGFAWEKAGRIWYDTLCDGRLANDADFAAFAHLSGEVAGGLYGKESAERRAVLAAWKSVGLGE